MKFGHGLATDGFSEPARDRDRPAPRRAPGLIDQFGDRLLIFDGTSARSFELLRFREALTAIPGFEVALRRRVERLSQFRHPSFATALSVEYEPGGRGLILVSELISGRRLSELLHAARSPWLAISLLRQIAPALAILHDQGTDIAHGALTPSRIVVTPEGQSILTEHVLGSALERLDLTAARLYDSLGVPVPPIPGSMPPALDSRTDWFQLGLVVLALLLGRRLSSAEYPHHLGSAVEAAAPLGDPESAALFRGLRTWLQRALQIGGRRFEASAEALQALGELPDPGVDGARAHLTSFLSTCSSDGGFEPQDIGDAALPLSGDPHLELSGGPRPAAARSSAAPTHAGAAPEPRPYGPPSAGTDVLIADGQIVDSARDDARLPSVWPQPVSPGRPPEQTTTEKASPAAAASSKNVAWRKRRRVLVGVAAVLALAAVAEAIVIATLVQRRRAEARVAAVAEISIESQDPGASVVVDGRPAGVTPVHLKISPDTRSIAVHRPAQQALPRDSPVGSTGQDKAAAQESAAPTNPRTIPPAAVVPVPQSSGGIRLVSPIELEVFEGDRRLGSSATGIVSATAGRHDLELVNSALGFRSRHVVEVKGGQVVPLALPTPRGRININAAPWAEVWINGKPAGETPIGNLELPLGEHEIVFRHPQLGEQRRTVVVRGDVVARVSASMQRQP